MAAVLPSGGTAAWGRLDKAALEACLCTAALALATVMAGSGHLPTLRLLRGAPPWGPTPTPKPFIFQLCHCPLWYFRYSAPAHAATKSMAYM